MNNIVDATRKFKAKKLIADVERLLKENDQLDQYDVGIEWYDNNKHYCIMLKKRDTQIYTVLDPEMLGIEI